MKLLLNAQGSLGDFRPLLTLAKGLKTRGHQVTLCAPPDFQDLCSSSGIPYRRLGPEIARIIEKYAPEIATPLDGALFLSRTFLKETLSQYFEQLLPLAEDSDMLIGSGIDFSGGSIAERAGIPYRFVAFSPVAFASSQHPPITFPISGMPRCFNKAAWDLTRIGESVLGIRQLYNKHRKRLGLKPVSSVADYMASRAIVAADPGLAPMPSDVKATYLQTGYWFEAEQAELEPELAAFIKNGLPPVYAGFGSMPPSKRLAVVIMELARSGKHRFVAQKSTVAPLLTHNTPGIFLIDSAPHSKLFPLLSVAIHHGGSGTTHTAARAAIPQIIVPYSFDQYYWGDLAWRAGIAPKPITRRSLSSENLATALLHAPLFKRKAGELALAIQHRNGLDKALDHIENLLKERT